MHLINCPLAITNSRGGWDENRIVKLGRYNKKNKIDDN